ncbi:MAG: hypothetical protein JOZ83_03980 [Silvibacterium sp.]|nr:hypothetical protein [Silvibacterium sp.]
MRTLPFLLFPWLLTASAALLAQSPSVCPTSAVFLALPNQVRGYPTKANGPTAPCQIIHGPQTTLTTANSVSVSINGYLHVLQFLTNGTIAVFLPEAHGNVAPNRIESVLNNDLTAETTDRKVNDFVLSSRDSDAAISVTERATTRAEFAFIAPGISVASALSVDKDDNLLVGGWDTAGNALVETLETSTSLGAPAVVRQLTGPATGIFPADVPAFGIGYSTMSIAADPENGELYVYTNSPQQNIQKILVFPQGASGNVAPSRVISGPLTRIGPPSPVFTNKIAVASDGRLYVSEANETILVFAPGAHGNVPPAQIIQDSTIGTTPVGAAGIGVRSCTCCQP